MINIEGLCNAKKEDFFDKDNNIREGMVYYVHSYHNEELEKRKVLYSFNIERIMTWLNDSRVYVNKDKKLELNDF